MLVGSIPVTSPTGRNLSIYKTAQRMWPRILSIALEEELKILDFV